MNNKIDSNFQLQEDEGIDIKKYIFLILSHWWWFAVAVMISLTGAYMINRYSQEVYRASCSLIIGEPESRIGSVESIMDEFSRKRSKRRKAVVENEISILKSHKMARLALEELDFGVTYTAIGRRNIAERRLYENSPFVVREDTTKPSAPYGTYFITILSREEYQLNIGEEFKKVLRFGEKFDRGDYAFTIYLNKPEEYNFNPNESNKYYFTFRKINSLAKEYSNSLSIEVNDEKGSILILSLSGFVPEQVTDYLNRLCYVYVESNLEEKNLTSENTIKFIDEQLRGVVDSLEATGLRLQEFRSANKVINLTREGTFLFEKMQDLQSEKAKLEIKDRYYNYLLEYIQKRTDFSDVVAPSVVGIEDKLLNSLVAELNQLNLERRNLSLSVVEKSPQTFLLNNRISSTRNALQENLQSLIEGNSIATVELNERIVNIEKKVQKLPGTERQLINIEREFTINDQIYTFLLEKRAEAGITKASNTSDHLILDIARPENASVIKPDTSMNYVMAFAFGGAIPLVLLLLIEFLNTKITDRKYLENNLHVPVIGNIGHHTGGTELPVNENPRSSLVESFRALRTNLQYLLKEPEQKVIAVTSAVSGEGKTFCSINLASILSLAEKKILLVSLDLRRPKVHKVFNFQNKIGISTYLIGKNSYNEIISDTNINNLYVATSGPIPPNPAELLGSKKMAEFIQLARRDFDYIILDTPPVAIVTDTLTLKNVFDIFVFVIRHNYSDKQVVGLVNSIKERGLVDNVGIIINDILVKGYYGYSYKYGYSYNYDYRETYYGEKVEEKGIKNLLGKLRFKK